jgi:hypothetical protein
MRIIAFVAATALASLSTLPARATEYLAAGTKLVIKDTSVSKKLVYLSKDPSVDVPIPAGADDPSVVGATFTVNANNGNGAPEIAQFALPASGWSLHQTSHGAHFRFTNRAAPAGSSPVRSVLIRAGLLKLKAEDSGITLDEVRQTGIGVRLDAGPSRWCADFGTNIVENKTGVFRAKAQALPPTGCVARTTTTTITTSTTLPHVCGNGIIEQGEQCDGEDFCTATCSINTVACCEFGAPPGPVCAGPAGALWSPSEIYHICYQSGGTYMLGSSPSGTEHCSEAPESAPITNGPCQPGGPVSPTTLCCDADDCSDAAVDDMLGVSAFVSTCAFTPPFQWYPVPVVVGTCGVPPVGGVHPGAHCVPAH